MSLLLAAALAASKTTPTEPSRPVDTSTLTARRSVADNTGWHRYSSTAQSSGTTVIVKHKAGSDANRLAIRYGLHGWAGLNNGLSAKWSLVVDGAIYPVTWGGSHKTTIPMDMAHHDSDPLPDSVVVRAGQTIFSVMEVDAGTAYPSGFMASDRPVSRSLLGTIASTPIDWDAPMTSSIVSGAPIMILGNTSPSAKSFVALGDSILESGWMRAAAIANGVTWTDLGQWAEPVPQTQKLSGRLSASDRDLFTLGISEYGTNADAANVRQNLLAFWQWMVAGPVPRLAQTTMVPYVRSDSPDFSTLDGQIAEDPTTGRGLLRATLNPWLLDGAPIVNGAVAEVGAAGAVRAGEAGHPLIGICDAGSQAQAINSRGEAVWDVRLGVPTKDGVHPETPGAALMEPYVTQWIADHI